MSPLWEKRSDKPYNKKMQKSEKIQNVHDLVGKNNLPRIVKGKMTEKK